MYRTIKLEGKIIIGIELIPSNSSYLLFTNELCKSVQMIRFGTTTESVSQHWTQTTTSSPKAARMLRAAVVGGTALVLTRF